MLIIILFLTVVYIIIVSMDIHFQTTRDVCRDGICRQEDRDPTPKDVWWAAVWPIRFLIWFIVSLLYLLFVIIFYSLLAFGINLKSIKAFMSIKTKIKNYIM